MLRFYFSPFGRVSRKELWLRFILPYFLLGSLVLVGFLMTLPKNRDSEIAAIGSFVEPWMILFLPVWWASVVIVIKRLHDRGMSAFWLLPTVLWWGIGNLLFLSNPGLVKEAQNLFLILGLLTLCVSIWVGINIYFLRGVGGSNRFGADPLEEA